MQHSNRSMALIMSSLLLPLLPALVSAQCSGGLTPSQGVQPTVASGFAYAVVATGLTSPRGIQFDSAANLLVIEKGKGLSSWTVDAGSAGDGACGVTLKGDKDLIGNTKLNHGIALSTDQSKLYVSTSSDVLAYDYDAGKNAIGTASTIVVTNMDNADHTSRTLLYPAQAPGDWLVVSRGSSENLDLGAADKSTGHSQVKAFNLSSVPNGGYDFNKDGTLLGWGLRNSVGVAQHPDTGGIWAVENSVDNLERMGEDVHMDNPGEELNFLGYLNSTDTSANYGYPFCYAAWKPNDLPQPGQIEVGNSFSPGSGDCTNITSPRLTWQAHTVRIINSQTVEAHTHLH